MSKRIPQPLSYASPDLQGSPWAEKAGKLFWPIMAVMFVATVLIEAGVGWAAAVYQLLTSGLLLVGWLLAAYGWGVLPWRVFRLPTGDALARVTILASGLGLQSLLVLGLGLVGVMNGVVAWAIVVVGWIALLLYLLRIEVDSENHAGAERGAAPDASALQERSDSSSQRNNPRRRFALPRRVDPSVDLVHYWWLLIIPLAGVTITCAMLPAGFLWGADEPNAYDVVEYHLQVPREWFELGRIVPLHHNVFSFFPFNVEMHYLFAMHLMGGPWVAQFLAQMMHAAYVGLTVAAVYAAAAERGRFAAIMAALLAASAPWLPMLGSIAYNEGGLLLYGTLAIAWALRAIMPKDEGGRMKDEKGGGIGHLFFHPSSFIFHRYAVSGVMAGFACGCKLTGVPLLLIGIPAALFAVWALGPLSLRERAGGEGQPALPSGGLSEIERRLPLTPALSRRERGPIPSWRARLGGLAVFVVAGLLVFSPWLIRNYAWAGNPVFPEQQKLLGRGHFSLEQSERFYKAHKPRPDQQAMTVRVAELWRQVFADWRFGYALLPIGTVTLLLTIRRLISLFLLLMLFGLTAFWLVETHLQGRFYVLSIPVVALSIGSIEARSVRLIAAMCAIGSLLISYGFVNYKMEAFDASFSSRTRTSVRALIGTCPVDSSQDFQRNRPSEDMTLVLVGDAKAFWYQLPMTQLRYRTVFDAQCEPNGSAIDAWCSGLPLDYTYLLSIDVGELERFHRTYGTPLLPKDISPNTNDDGSPTLWPYGHWPAKPGSPPISTYYAK